MHTKNEKKTSPAVKALSVVGAASLALYGAKVLIDFYGPQPRYAMRAPDCPLDSDAFIQFLSLVTDGTRRRCQIDRLKNGDEFYPAMLDAILGARRAINLEMYEFREGRVSAAILEALTERALAGVEVKLIVDAVGSLQTANHYFSRLRAAGGEVCWYHPLRWNTWQNLNQRTHRKLLIVDSRIGFIGGAGIADCWMYPTGHAPVWRDTMFRVEGEQVAGLISTFCENWLETSGEILSGPRQFELQATPGGSESFVVSSTPRGGGTQARILFLALINSAKESIRITTPYFLPDRSARHALAEAVERRGVKVQILTAGPHIDHPIVRTLSRHSSRHLLRAGAEIFEYQPSMIHAKVMTVDSLWSVVGSTNFDHRSFALNDEVNMAILDRDLGGVIERDFEEDLAQSLPLTLATLRDRTPLGKIEDILVHPLEEES